MYDGHDCCDRNCGVGGVAQTLDEMDFERGPWTAAVDGDFAALQKYLDKGGEPNLRDSAGYTPLHYAARKGFETICKALIDHGASVNAETRAGKTTPLHRAALSDSSAVVKLLLEHNADACAQDTDGRTPLHKAVEGNSADSCRLLIDHDPRCCEIMDKNHKYARDYANSTLEGSEVYKVLKWRNHGRTSDTEE